MSDQLHEVLTQAFMPSSQESLKQAEATLENVSKDLYINFSFPSNLSIFWLYLVLCKVRLMIM